MESNNQSLEIQVNELAERAGNYRVTNPETLDAANSYVVAIKAILQKVLGFFAPMKKKAYESHQEILKKEKEMTAPLYSALSLVTPEITAYLAEQRRIYQKAQENARKLAEEKAREAREADEAVLRAALAAEEANKPAEAEKILEDLPKREVYKPPPIPAEPKLKGSYLRIILKWRVIDSSIIPREFLKPDAARTDAVVRQDRKKTNIPGIEVFEQESTSIRS